MPGGSQTRQDLWSGWLPHEVKSGLSDLAVMPPPATRSILTQ